MGLILAVGGCEKKDGSPAVPPRVAPGDVRGSGVIRGRVKLDGPPPEMHEIANEPCHPGATPLKEEFVVVGEGGGLANAFVYIEGGPAVDGSSLQAAVLDQANCRYSPHAIGVCVGQPLRIRSSDPAVHNVHYAPRRNEAKNFGMTRAGDEKTVTFEYPEFIHAGCDVHPWMNATIGVFDNAFFAVTDENGSFEIARLPPGKYELLAWHERYGKLKQQVNVSEAAQTVEVVYKAPPNR